MGMASDVEEAEYAPTYRQKDVDATLDDHEARITRLEKAGLIVLGYAVAEGGNIIEQLSTVLL